MCFRCCGRELTKSPERKVIVGCYRIALPTTWLAANYNPPKDLVVAIRKKEKNGAKQIGEILASPLPGSVDKESSELIASAKKNPEIISVVESAEFVTKDGVKGKKSCS